MFCPNIYTTYCLPFSLALVDFKKILKKNKDAMNQRRDQEGNERQKKMDNFNVYGGHEKVVLTFVHICSLEI